MARWIGPRTEHDHFGKILAAAQAWRDSCFLDGGSMFGDAPLWTPENMADFARRLEVDPLDGQKADFYAKLERQLETARPEEKQLAAEAIWFAYLFLWKAEMLPQTKRDRITLVWGWSGANPINDHAHLTDETLCGVGRAGQGFRQRLSWELHFLMRVVGEWRTLPSGRRIQLMRAESPWNFADWLDSLEYAEKRQVRHMILLFLFPDHFERIASRDHKKKIVEQLGHRATSIPEGVSTNGEFDRALYEIRRALEAEYGTQELDFYTPPLSDLWDKSSRKPPTPAPAPDPTTKPEPEPAVWHAPLNTILFGPPGTGKTFATIRRSVELCDARTGLRDEEIRSRFQDLVGGEGRVEFITFHESYSYEEFVEGLRPVTSKSRKGANSGFRLKRTPGVLMRIAERARANPNEAHVLVIDEINRANISKVLGELITVLEADKRQDGPNEIAVRLPYSKNRFKMPSNLFILGTMNTADRSIALLDTALRRRFEFEEVSPDPDLLPETIEGMEVCPREVLRVMNDRLEWFRDRDHRIGHAWLMDARTREEFDDAMRRKVIPLIAEFFYDEWEKIRAVLGNTDDFVARHSLDVPPGIDEWTDDRFHWSVRDEFAPGAYANLVRGTATPTSDEGSEG